MASYYSSGVGVTPQGVSINTNRRLFAFGDRIAFLRPENSLFFAYMSRLRKSRTNSVIFKMLERRQQWQRRQFEVEADKTGQSIADPLTITDFRLTTKLDKFGRVVTADTAPIWFLTNQMLTVECEINDGPGSVYVKHRMTCRVTVVGTATSAYVPLTVVVHAIDSDTDYAVTFSGKTLRAVDGKRGRLHGSAFAEATGAPDGWEDQLYDREAYCQIFKTSVKIISGSTMAEEFRGIRSEWQRIWPSKIDEHRNDIAEAMLFNTGSYSAEDGSGDPQRFTWGFLPYIEKFGTVKNWSYGATKYDDFTDHAQGFFDRRKGGSRVKMVFASAKWITWALRLGSPGFLANSMGTNAYQIRVGQRESIFFPGSASTPAIGLHDVITVRTPHGQYNFVEEALLSELFEDYCCVIDMPNVEVRPLVGNGISRDTFITTNVQANDMDGRKDLITTELGLWVGLPELHEVWRFN